MLQSIDEETWRQLEVGLKQIPQPYQLGRYRIFLTEVPAPDPGWLAKHLPGLIKECITHGPDDSYYLASKGIPDKVLQKVAAGYAAEADPATILAVIGIGGSVETGLTLTTEGAFYRSKLGADRFHWTDLCGALVGWFELEIVLRDFTRIRLPESLSSKSWWEVERLLNEITELESSGIS